MAKKFQFLVSIHDPHPVEDGIKYTVEKVSDDSDKMVVVAEANDVEEIHRLWPETYDDERFQRIIEVY